MDTVMVYMTAGDRTEAERIGRALVETRLAACVNIIDPMESIYRWEGGVQQNRETVLIAKTTQEKVPELKEKVVEVHSYDCPCVLVLPVSDGHAPFLAWIQGQVSSLNTS